MFKLIEQKMVPLDKRLAKKFANMRPCPGERPVSTRRLDHLHRRLVEGSFHSPNWASCKMNGAEYRVNGHHSSQMLLQCAEFPTDLQAFVMIFKADSGDDLPELFAQFDSKYSSRNSSEIAGAHGGIHPELSGLSGQTISRIVFAIALSETNCWATCKGSRPDEEDRARLIHDEHNRQFAIWASEKLTGQRSTNLSGVIAASFRTWTRDPRYADVFWGHVVKEGHPDPVHPTRMLAKLLNMRVADTGTTRWPPRRYLVHSMRAWNAARTSKTIKSLGQYKDDSAIPFTK